MSLSRFWLVDNEQQSRRIRTVLAWSAIDLREESIVGAVDERRKTKDAIPNIAILRYYKYGLAYLGQSRHGIWPVFLSQLNEIGTISAVTRGFMPRSIKL